MRHLLSYMLPMRYVLDENGQYGFMGGELRLNPEDCTYIQLHAYAIVTIRPRRFRMASRLSGDASIERCVSSVGSPST